MHPKLMAMKRLKKMMEEQGLERAGNQVRATRIMDGLKVDALKVDDQHTTTTATTTTMVTTDQAVHQNNQYTANQINQVKTQFTKSPRKNQIKQQKSR